MKNILHFVLATLIVLTSCSQRGSKPVDYSNPNTTTISNIYAQGFSICEVENGTVLNVFNPWQEANDVKYSYFLAKKGLRENNSNFNEVIPVPVNRIVCLSTTHIAYIDRLESGNQIVGVSGTGFVSSKFIRQRIEKGLVSDVGYEQALNYELIVSLKPDVVFAYGVGAEMAGYLQKLKDLKIPVVFIGDYLEENPLGKAEWIKAFGLFVDKYSIADSIFNQIATEYNHLKEVVSDFKEKPAVFINLPWKDVWYFPGGQGYMASLINDAGGNYLLSHLAGSRSYPFSIENAMEYAAKADIWINTGTVNSVSDISAELPILKGLPIISSESIFNNNCCVNASGGNDFWESGVINPHIILKDLVKIFHPHQLEHQLVYYKKVKK